MQCSIGNLDTCMSALQLTPTWPWVSSAVSIRELFTCRLVLSKVTAVCVCLCVRLCVAVRAKGSTAEQDWFLTGGKKGSGRRAGSHSPQLVSALLFLVKAGSSDLGCGCLCSHCCSPDVVKRTCSPDCS